MVHLGWCPRVVSRRLYPLLMYLSFDDARRIPRRRQAKEVREKIVERNPYADAIGRESVASARLLKAAQTKTKTRETPPNNTTPDTKHSSSNSRQSPTTAIGILADDPTGMGGDMETTAVQRW